MKRTRSRRPLSSIVGTGIAALTVLLLARGLAAEKPPPKAPPRNVGQAIPPIANPNEKTNPVQQAPANAPEFSDLNKSVIESPTKRILAARTAPGTAPPASEFVNPKVEPGKVHWHKTFADASTAAKKSGKPVLLFQMMGKLDDRFC